MEGKKEQYSELNRKGKDLNLVSWASIKNYAKTKLYTLNNKEKRCSDSTCSFNKSSVSLCQNSSNKAPHTFPYSARLGLENHWPSSLLPPFSQRKKEKKKKKKIASIFNFYLVPCPRVCISRWKLGQSQFNTPRFLFMHIGVRMMYMFPRKILFGGVVVVVVVVGRCVCVCVCECVWVLEIDLELPSRWRSVFQESVGGTEGLSDLISAIFTHTPSS